MTDSEALGIDLPSTQPKKTPRPTDPTLRLAAKLDRLLAGMPEEMQGWALCWLMSKYRSKVNIAQGCNQPPI